VLRLLLLLLSCDLSDVHRMLPRRLAAGQKALADVAENNRGKDMFGSARGAACSKRRGLQCELTRARSLIMGITCVPSMHQNLPAPSSRDAMMRWRLFFTFSSGRPCSSDGI
jgi:hypothetical protein